MAKQERNHKSGQSGIKHKLREFTDLELGYANSYLRLASLGRRLFSVFAGIFVILGLALLVAFPSESRSTEVEPYLVLFLASIAMIAGGAMALKISLQRKYTFDRQVCKIEGILEEKSYRVVYPNTGGASTKVCYRIGDTLIIWPPGSESIYKPHVDQHVELTVALFKRSNPVVMMGGRSMFDETAQSALVLAFDDSIQIHKTLDRYGRYYFHRYIAKSIIAWALAISVGIYGFFYLADRYQSSEFSAFSLVLIIFGSVCGGAVGLAILWTWFEKLVKAFNLRIDITPHSEKLKG